MNNVGDPRALTEGVDTVRIDDDRYHFPLWSDRYRLRITLNEIEPRIWRQILVPQDMVLSRLHDVLQVVMGWQNSHLHEFTVGDVCFGEPDEENEIHPIDYRAIRLNQLAPHQGSSFGYHYDFGDSWRHTIVVEKMVRAEHVTDALPLCEGGGRACPREDCGGPPGYSNLVEALRDPHHPEHADYRMWAGPRWDPEHFDVAAVNNRLNRFRPRQRATAASRRTDQARSRRPVP